MPENKGKVTYEKYTKEELEKALLFIDGAFDSLESVFALLKNDELIERAKKVLDDESIPAEEIYYLVDEFYEEIAKHIRKEDLPKLGTIDSNTHQMVDIILRHPEYYEGGLTKEDRLTLMAIERKNPRALFKWSNLPIGQTMAALEYSPGEKDAVSTYAGQDDYDITDNPNLYVEFIYETYNMLFFPGLTNEKARVYDEMRTVYPEVLTDTEHLLDFSRKLYKALYKSSRKLPDELNVRRVDRVATIEAMEESGEVVSNYSTTLSRRYGDFGKTHSALVKGKVHKGVIAGDFAEILKGEYSFDSESELLIAPGAKVTIEDMEVTDLDRAQVPGSYNNVDRKVKIDFYARSRTISPLSDSEKEDEKELLEFLTDRENSSKAAKFLTEINKIRKHNVTDNAMIDDPTIPFDEAVNMIDPEIVEAYLQFKDRFVRVYRYMAREVAMEVESSLERADQNYREGIVETPEQLWEYGVQFPRKKPIERVGAVLKEEPDLSIVEPTNQESQASEKAIITEDDLIKVAKEERTEDIISAIDTFGKVVGEKEFNLDQELGK